MRIPNKKWQKILDQIIIKEVPYEFLKKIQVILLDGNIIEVNSKEELKKLLEEIKENTTSDPVKEIAFLFDYRKLSKNVEIEVAETLNNIKKGTNGKRTRRRKIK